MIVVDRLRKTFEDLRHGPVVAVDAMSFECRAGEIFGLLGPNGAGKTTTLRILSTLLRPSAGRARVAGYDVVTQAAAVRRHIGFMSASTANYDRMTGWEMVEYFGKLYGLPDAVLYPRMERLFAELQMTDARDVLASKMSTGMKQKVSIARTVIHDPPVLILDEPTAGLDVLVVRAVRQSIAGLRAQGKCILFSSHIMSEVAKLCDRVAIVHRGRILAGGTIAELCAQYRQPDFEELFFELIRRHDEDSGGAHG